MWPTIILGIVCGVLVLNQHRQERILTLLAVHAAEQEQKLGTLVYGLEALVEQLEEMDDAG